MIILNKDPMVAARELCDKDLRAVMKRAADLVYRSLYNADDSEDTILQWVNKSKANLKWMSDYAMYCAAESYYRYGPKARVSYRVTKLPDIKAGKPRYLPCNLNEKRQHYIENIAPESIWPDCLWTKRYPPDWLAPFIYPNAKLS